jgi:hypothetical protein
MRLFNLKRGKGKTIRMLYASEFNHIPILCHDNIAKQHLISKAEELEIDIPTPISVGELSDARIALNTSGFYVDEIPLVLQSLIKKINPNYRMVGGTITTYEEER